MLVKQIEGLLWGAAATLIVLALGAVLSASGLTMVLLAVVVAIVGFVLVAAVHGDPLYFWRSRDHSR